MKQKNGAFSFESSAEDTKVRLIDEEENIVTTLGEAKNRARCKYLDLVLVGEGELPVLKICDYNKMVYDEQKKHKEKEAKCNEKEVRLGANISEHDMKVKAAQIDKMLSGGCTVKIVIRFKGRLQRLLKSSGDYMINSLLEMLAVKYKVAKPKQFTATEVIITLA